MNKKKRANKKIQEIISRELDRQLKENPPRLPSLEEFKIMARDGLHEAEKKLEEITMKKRRRKNLGMAGATCVIIVAMIVGVIVMSSSVAHVGANETESKVRVEAAH